MCRELELDVFLQIRQRGAEEIPVVHARLDERGQLLQLLAANGRLRVERLQVVAEVRVNVFVVVAFGQFAEFPAEAFMAGVVLAAGAPAIAAPVAETFREHLELHVADDIHRAAFAHRQVMRRIKALRGQVAERAGEFPVVAAAQRVAVVLDEPEMVFSAKVHCGGEVKRIAQRVRHHHGLGLAGHERGFELVGAAVERGRVVVNEHRHAALLQNRRDGRRKTGGAGDDFVPGAQLAVAELGAGQRGQRHQIRGRAGVDEEGFFDAEQRGQFVLEGVALRPKRQPEIQSRRHGGFDFVLGEHAAGIRHGGLAGHERRAFRVGPGAVGGVGGGGKLAGEAEDFGFEFGGSHFFIGKILP